MRRRRRRGRALNPRVQIIIGAVAVAILLGAFFYFGRVAESIDPERTEQRIELPDALKD